MPILGGTTGRRSRYEGPVAPPPALVDWLDPATIRNLGGNMTRRSIVLMLALAALAPARPAVAACTTQKDHHCACTTQMTSATCCCTGKEIPAKAQGEAPQVQQADPGLLPASVETTLTSRGRRFRTSLLGGPPPRGVPHPAFPPHRNFSELDSTPRVKCARFRRSTRRTVVWRGPARRSPRETHRIAMHALVLPCHSGRGRPA